MKKEFVPYKQALALKELGFNEPCFGWWFADEEMLIIDKSTKSTSENIIQAPLFQQAFRWFREKYDLFCWIEKFHKDETYIFQIPPANFTKIQGHFKTYEEAELACLIKLIEIVKNF
jgi:hypothetical protein